MVRAGLDFIMRWIRCAKLGAKLELKKGQVWYKVRTRTFTWSLGQKKPKFSLELGLEEG